MQIMWHLKTTAWEVPAHKLQVVANTLKGRCPWDCSTGGFVNKMLGSAPWVYVMRMVAAAPGLNCSLSKNPDPFQELGGSSLLFQVQFLKNYHLRNSFVCLFVFSFVFQRRTQVAVRCPELKEHSHIAPHWQNLSELNSCFGIWLINSCLRVQSPRMLLFAKGKYAGQ